MLFNTDLLSDVKPALAEQSAPPRKILATLDDPPEEQLCKTDSFDREASRSASQEDAMSSYVSLCCRRGTSLSPIWVNCASA